MISSNVTSSVTSATKNIHLKNDLGLLESLSIVLGRIIGSGIFRTPGPMMIAVTGLDTDLSYSLTQIPMGQISVGLFFIAWIIGGLATYLAALCYAELVAMLPRSGGPYEYLKEAYPEWVTFLRGWAMFFVSETASIVAVALVFASYTDYLFKNQFAIELGLSGQTLLALLLIWALTIANMLGIFTSGILQNVFSFLKLTALLLIIFMCSGLMGTQGSTSNFSDNLWPAEWGWQTVLGMAAALRFGFFAYSGWEGATYIAEEVKNPSKTLPRSLFVGIGAVLIIYLGVNAAYVYQLGPAEMIVSKKEIAANAMKSAAGILGGLVLAGMVLISTAGNVSTQILVKARTWYAMARDGLFFSPLSKLSDRYATPNRSMLAQGVWASVLLLTAFAGELWTSGSGGNLYDRIISFFSFTSAIFNLLTFAAVAVLRHKMPNMPRPFRVPLFRVTLSITMLIYGTFLVLTLIDKPVESLTGVFLTCTGLIYYYFKRIRPNKKA